MNHFKMKYICKLLLLLCCGFYVADAMNIHDIADRLIFPEETHGTDLLLM